MGKVFGGAPEVPPGMRQKELSEELMEPLYQTAGIIGGAASKAADITKPFARKVVGLPNLKTPEELKATKEIRKQRQDLDKEFADRAGEPALQRLRMDVRDNLEGILELVNLLRVTEDFTPKEYSTVEHLYHQMQKGAETGGQMVTGTVADFWQFTEDPEEYFNIRPATTVMMVAPVLAELKGMAAANYGPAVKAFADPKVKAAADFIDNTAQKITKSKAKPLQATSRFMENTRRLLTDPTVQATERASKFVDELMNEVKRTGDSIGTIADRYVQTLKKENIVGVRKKGIDDKEPLLRQTAETLRETYPVTKKELEARAPEDIPPDVPEFETGEPLTPEQKKRAREMVQQPQQLSLPLVTEDLGKTTYVEPPQPSRLVADEKNILQIVDSLEPEIVPITEAQKKLLRDVYTKKTKLTPEVEGEFVGIKERLKRHGIDLDKRIQEGLPAAFVDDYDYLPESKSIGSSREAVQLRAEGLDLEKPGDWERFIEIRDTDPVYILKV
jgi:hypothetical protein